MLRKDRGREKRGKCMNVRKKVMRDK
jgi:hypothetical protein